tara:strand:- start:2 stop:451 length:450 start_codon:yes stop_codon:yes gene_type:complete
MTQVYISIGSNINAEENITLVKSKLKKLFACSFSDVFHSNAIGFKGKDFLNLVVGFTYESDPYSLNNILKNIEVEMGRDQDQKGMSDRIIDLDIILFGKLVIQHKDFSIPSKDIKNHLYVLEPLAQIAEKQIHPVFNISFGEMLKEKLR